MDIMDKQYAESVQSMTKNMEKLTESISEGFCLMRMILRLHPLQCMQMDQWRHAHHIIPCILQHLIIFNLVHHSLDLDHHHLVGIVLKRSHSA